MDSAMTHVTYSVPSSGDSFVSGAFELAGLPSLAALRVSWPFAGTWALRLRVRAGDVGPGAGAGALGDEGYVWLDLTGAEPVELLSAACAAGAAAVRGLPLDATVLGYDGAAAEATAAAHADDFDLSPEEFDRWRAARARARGMAPSPRAGDTADRSGAPLAGLEDAGGSGGSGGNSSNGGGVGVGGDAAAAVGGFFKGFAAAAGAASKAVVAAASKGSGGWFKSMIGGGSHAGGGAAPGGDDEFPGSAPSADAPTHAAPLGRTPGGVDVEWRT